uniref:Actin interacting protein 3-like C-terminal domain-containing protein n=1 Tax=Electrophorus electricus TaxID=8005 RepID=A0A4W4GA77_ELEEL
MQPSDMDKKREAFLEHLKQKYPHHASAIMGHQERLREQSRSPKQGVSCPSPVPAFGEQPEQGSQASLDTLEAMSECDAPSAFTRGSRSRASLPVVRSTNQTKDRSLGVLYLQYGDDTKQIRMPNEITGVDTVRALFVSAFPLQLSMKMLESPSTAIYVKDDMRNMYYELSDVRGIVDQSCLKVYHKDPAQAFSHGARPSNGDTRMHREVMYAARDGPLLMRQASLGLSPTHAMQGSMSPPTPQSMPPSPSRIPFGPRPPGPAGATVPRERAGQSFRKDAPVSMDMVVKSRNALASPVTPDLQPHCPLVPPGDPQTRDTTVKSGSPVHSMSSTGGSPVLGPRSSTVPPESFSTSTPPISSTPLQVNLAQFRKNVSELRLQLQQMRQLQLQNQECVRAQIKQAEQEISVRLAEALRLQEDPSHKQRMLVEEDRHKYLSMEERVLTQLGDLEFYVESLKREPSSDVTPRCVTLKEVEEGAISLRKVGEHLAGLKGEFPGLQARMRAVLRVEVEAVKFLKEEPHKLDSMLKRVKVLTDALSTLRRSVTEGLLKPPDPVTMTTLTAVEGVESAPPADLQDPVTTPLLEPQSSSVRSEVINSNPVVIHHAQSSPVTPRQCQQSAAPSSASPVQLKKPSALQPDHGPSAAPGDDVVHDGGASPVLFIEEITNHSKGKNRATSIEAAEREWEEKRQNMGHYDGPKFERMLQEAEANMLRGIPSLEGPSKGDSPPSPSAVAPAALEDMVEKHQPSAIPAQENNQPESPSSEKPPKTGPEKAPKGQLEKPAKATTVERPAKANLTVKTSLEKATKHQDKVTKLSQGPDKTNKPPPPPPPRRNYPTTPPSTGMTTTRSGELVCISRKESGSVSAPKSKPKSPVEAKPKSCAPPALPASAVAEGEDNGDKIMAELQVFQKCSVKDVGLKGLVEPQIKELRPGALPPLRDKKVTDMTSLSCPSSCLLLSTACP